MSKDKLVVENHGGCYIEQDAFLDTKERMYAVSLKDKLYFYYYLNKWFFRSLFYKPVGDSTILVRPGDE